MSNRVTVLASIALITLTLAACAPPPSPPNADIIVPQPKVVTVDPSLFSCPTATSHPKPETLTDAQASKVIVELKKNNITCSHTIIALKKYLKEAEDIIKKNVKADKYGDVY